MIARKHYLETIRQRLKSFPVVSVLGPRQVGKTTLALAIAEAVPSIYLDLEDPADRDKLEKVTKTVYEQVDKSARKS